MRKKFSEWYAQQVTELYVNEPVDLSSAQMECLDAQWMKEVVEHLADNPHIIINGFRHAGIYTALGLIDDDVVISPTMMILVLNPTLIEVVKITCLKVRSQVLILITLKEEKLGRKYAC